MPTNDCVRPLQDLRHLHWSRIRQSSGTAGSFLKSYSVSRGVKTYYKLSCFDSVHGITGHECVNEIIADRLLTILGIPHLYYQLIHAQVNVDGADHETWLCASADFKEPGDSKMPLDDYYELMREPGESPLAFCLRQGWQDYFAALLITDYLILNRDRHGANIEVLRNRAAGTISLAPLFDHGLSLLYSCRSEAEAAAFDVMQDLPVQSFIGSRSAYENLQLIPPAQHPRLRPLEERDRYTLLQDLEDALPEVFLEQIWNMIWRRWKVYESLSDHR